MESLRGELLEAQTTGGAHGLRLGKEVNGRGKEESEDGKSRVLGADFLNIVETLKIPGLDVECGGLPVAAGENEEKLVEGLGAMNLQVGVRGFNQGLR